MNRLFLSTIAICAVTIAYSQTQAPFQGPLTNMKGSDYKFTIIKSVDANAVQNQNQTPRLLLLHKMEQQCKQCAVHPWLFMKLFLKMM